MCQKFLTYMKNKIALVFALAFVVLITNSCNKSGDGQTLSVTIDGTSYSINSSSMTYNTAVVGTATHYTFTFTLGTVTLYMYLPAIKTGTFYFSSEYNPGPGLELPGANGETYFSEKNNVAARGSIVISSNTSSTISGTFSGVLYPEPSGSLKYTDSTTINNGVFSNVEY